MTPIDAPQLSEDDQSPRGVALNAAHRAARANRHPRALAWWTMFLHFFGMTVVRLTVLCSLLLAAASVFFALVALEITENPSIVTIEGYRLFVNGEPYIVQGVNYSPIPRGQTGTLPPYGDYFSDEYAVDGFLSASLGVVYTPNAWWVGVKNIFVPGPSFEEAHLKELSKTFNTIRVYTWDRAVSHHYFLDLCTQHGLMVIITFQMDSFVYPNLTSKKTVSQVLTDFRRMIREVKGHPAVLMWAIGNEPNNAQTAGSYASELNPFFQVVQQLVAVRDDEEGYAPYSPHPMVVPMADYPNISSQLGEYDFSQFDVWGVNAYRGASFYNLFATYPSVKPLLLTEFGMDAYYDTINSPKEQSAFYYDPAHVRNGTLLQDQAVVALAKELVGQNSQTVPGAKCIGGLVFEYTDEYWKGVLTDTFHINCFDDNSSIQSLCGYPAVSPNYSDHRLIEEWFGLYNTSYPNGNDWLVQLDPRPAIVNLNAYWSTVNANGSNTTSRRRAAGQPPVSYQVVVPSPISAHIDAIWIWIVIPVAIMLLFGFLPYLWMCGRRRAPKEEAMQTPDFKAVHAEAGQAQVVFLAPQPDLPYRRFAAFISRLARLYWVNLSPGTYEEYVFGRYVLPEIQLWWQEQATATPLSHLTARLHWGTRFQDRIGPISVSSTSSGTP